MPGSGLVFENENDMFDNATGTFILIKGYLSPNTPHYVELVYGEEEDNFILFFFNTLLIVNPPNNSYKLTDLLPNTNYTFTLTAENGKSLSGEYTYTLTTAPLAPTGLTVTAGKAQASLRWETVRDWFAGVVNAETKAEFFDGFEDGTFKPSDNITRNKMEVMIIRTMRVQA